MAYGAQRLILAKKTAILSKVLLRTFERHLPLFSGGDEAASDPH